MKKLITTLLVVAVLVSGCTYLKYSEPNGRSVTYISTKEFKSLDVEVTKNKDGFVGAKLNAEGVTSDIVEQVGDAVEKGLNASSGSGIIEEILK